MNSYLIIKAQRKGYSIGDIYRTMTVGELIEELKCHDEDSKVVLSHDNGYTYGGIDWSDIDEIEEDELEDAE